MAYLPNIPAATDVISQSQSQIQGNFQALAPFGAGYVQLSQQATNPAVAGTNIALFQASTGGVSLKNAAGTVVDFTTKATGSNGWTRLPSGILIQWAQLAYFL